MLLGQKYFYRMIFTSANTIFVDINPVKNTWKFFEILEIWNVRTFVKIDYLNQS